MNAEVYWIRAAHHTNILCEGYVGVSKNANSRWTYGHGWAFRKNRHENAKLANAIAKHGWDNLIKTVVVISDESYCYDLERKLRPKELIGWNLAIGGGKPQVSKPRLIGRPPGNAGKPVSDETRAKLSAAKKGRKQTPEQIAKRVASRKATLMAQNRTC